MSSSSSSPHKRLQSSTRMDLLSMMGDERGRYPVRSSPDQRTKTHRDSLSPLRESFGTQKGSDASSTGSSETRKFFPPAKAQKGKSFVYLDSETSSGRPQTRWESTINRQTARLQHEAATILPTSTKPASSQRALPPPPRRPFYSALAATNGLVTRSTPDLNATCTSRDGNTYKYRTRTRVLQHPTDESDRYPPIDMGNKPSSVSGSPTPDDQSEHSVVRKPVNPVRFLRKGSANLILRIDSRSPLVDPTATPKVTVLKDPVTPNVAGDSDSQNASTNNHGDHPHKTLTAPIAVPPRKNSPSTVIVTDDDEEGRPLSASTTIKGRKSLSRNQSSNGQHGCPGSLEEPSTLTALRSSALSPTLPAPSPLPEDSPHKYGLLDRMDTPEIQPPAEDINAAKARRRNSGMEIFNEAKTLQSASSFLNGLSTSRRRAESASRTTDSYAHVSRPSSRRNSQSGPVRPTALRPSTSTPHNRSGDFEGRRKGHNFKANGFAYSRPLGITQLKCYRNHARMLMNKNKSAPVECAVCHMDDDQEHYSCSWCAIRMCRYCRKDFAERGISALRDRIKQAEMPSDDGSSSGSAASLV